MLGMGGAGPAPELFRHRVGGILTGTVIHRSSPARSPADAGDRCHLSVDAEGGQRRAGRDGRNGDFGPIDTRGLWHDRVRYLQTTGPPAGMWVHGDFASRDAVA